MQGALARLPDEPRWVDVRGMLLSGRAEVHGAPGVDPRGGSFVVCVRDVSLVAIVGEPPPGVIHAVVGALSGDVNVLVQHEDAGWAGRALGHWIRRTAILHVLPGVMPWESSPAAGTRVFTRETAPRLDHVEDELRRELLDALDGRTTARYVPGILPRHRSRGAFSLVPMAGAWDGPVPVAFCYPVWQTERWWDVSIDTLEPHRRKGLGARAARALITYLRQTGRAPVWGALETNTASRALAARLGFIEAAGISVFATTPPA